MNPIIFVVLVIVLIVVIFVIVNRIESKRNYEYESKVKSTMQKVQASADKYNYCISTVFTVQTNNKKIQLWTSSHSLDFIINANIEKVIRTLELYNEMKVWWENILPSLIEETKKDAIVVASIMEHNSERLIQTINNKLEDIIKIYDPSRVTFRFATYSSQSGGRRYNSKTNTWWDAEPSKEITFRKYISPSELMERIEILAEFNFELTEYQYDILDQRKLMTNELRQTIIQRDKSKCQICGKTCSYDEIEIDHIFPISRGGKTIITNLQVLCRSCNRSKSDKILDSLRTHIIEKPPNKGRTNLVTESQTDIGKIFRKPKEDTATGHGIKVGNFVKIIYLDTNETITLKIVEEDNVDVFNNKISVSSPIGSALLEKNVDDVLEIATKNGELKIKVLQIL